MADIVIVVTTFGPASSRGPRSWTTPSPTTAAPVTAITTDCQVHIFYFNHNNFIAAFLYNYSAVFYAPHHHSGWKRGRKWGGNDTDSSTVEVRWIKLCLYKVDKNVNNNDWPTTGQASKSVKMRQRFNLFGRARMCYCWRWLMLLVWSLPRKKSITTVTTHTVVCLVWWR